MPEPGMQLRQRGMGIVRRELRLDALCRKLRSAEKHPKMRERRFETALPTNRKSRALPARGHGQLFPRWRAECPAAGRMRDFRRTVDETVSRQPLGPSFRRQRGALRRTEPDRIKLLPLRLFWIQHATIVDAVLPD